MELQQEETRAANRSARNRAIGIALVTLTLGGAVLAVYCQQPPLAQPASAPKSEFASGRAMEHLKVIAGKPHPVGSAENSVVRDYILQKLTELGLSPEVQRATVLDQQRSGSYVAASVQNIIGRIVGTESRQTVLLACHYDSAPTSPGASDDGSGVAALLEVIRILKTDAPPKNDLLFLFTDGEEIGMLGAKAFMDEHPCARNVTVAFNFEARGIGGPSIMFETSEGNRQLIEEFAKVVQHPVANSLTDDLYRLLPNSTDMSQFKKGGLQGLNFAYIAGVSSYHTARDSYQNIDERSLQHQGASALALARHFGNLTGRPAPAGTPSAGAGRAERAAADCARGLRQPHPGIACRGG